MIDFAIRNLILFFKDRTAVFLSFLAEFIVLGLYILFMRENLVESFAEIENAPLLLDVWMLAGVLGITSVTTTMGAYGIMVDDQVKNIKKDFCVSPIKRYSLIGGYMGGAIVIALFMSLFLFLISAVYILQRYHVQLGRGMGVELVLLFCHITLANSSLVLFLISFLKSSNALAACSTILGALIGFLTGIYLPMGNLPRGVQDLVKMFPVSHSVVLLRRILMEPLIRDNIGEVNNVKAEYFMDYMGVRFLWKDKIVTVQNSVMVLTVTAIVFFLLTVVKVNYWDNKC